MVQPSGTPSKVTIALLPFYRCRNRLIEIPGSKPHTEKEVDLDLIPFLPDSGTESPAFKAP